MINFLFLIDIIRSVPDKCIHGSYTIMGNEKGWKFWRSYFNLCQHHLTAEESAEFPNELPDTAICMLVERCYDKLIGLAVSHNSRLAFQVLGDFLMTYGAKMTDDVNIHILKNSRWNDDRRQLKIKKDKTERKKYLLNFREKILTYKSGKQVKIPIESVTNVADRILKQEWEKNKKLIHNIESYIQRTAILE